MKIKPLNNLSVAILVGSLVIALSIITSSAINLFNNNPNSVDKAFENVNYVKVGDSPVLGNKDAPITIVGYFDFECPICKLSFDKVWPLLKRDYFDTGKVRYVYKSLPIVGLHKNALRKAEAALCAKDQGGDKKFFQYHDTLYERYNNIPEGDNALISIAQEQGLDTEKFKLCLEKEVYKEKIKKDEVEGNLIGSMGTPTWLIGKSDGDKIKDAVKINGLVDYKIYQTVIEELLSEN